jgi:hypothetical protein
VAVAAVVTTAVVAGAVVVATHHHRPGGGSGSNGSEGPTSGGRTSPPATVAAVYLGRCFVPGGALHTEPRSYVFGCDGTGELVQMRWSAWTRDQADGAGVARLDNCTPNCASGTFTSYPVIVHADQARACSNADPTTFYDRLVIAYPKAAPPDIGSPILRYRGHPASEFDDAPSGCALPPPPSYVGLRWIHLPNGMKDLGGSSLNPSVTLGFELIRDAEGREMVWLERFLGHTSTGKPIHRVVSQLYVGPLAAGEVVSFGNCARDPRSTGPDSRIVAITRPPTTGSIPVVRAWLIEPGPLAFRSLPADQVHCLVLGD